MYHVTSTYQPGDTIYLFKNDELVNAIVQHITKSGQLVAKAVDKKWANGEPLTVRFKSNGREWGESNYSTYAFHIVEKDKQEALARAKSLAIRQRRWAGRLRQYRDNLAIPNGDSPSRAKALAEMEELLLDLRAEHGYLTRIELREEEEA